MVNLSYNLQLKKFSNVIPTSKGPEEEEKMDLDVQPDDSDVTEEVAPEQGEVKMEKRGKGKERQKIEKKSKGKGKKVEEDEEATKANLNQDVQPGSDVTEEVSPEQDEVKIEKTGKGKEKKGKVAGKATKANLNGAVENGKGESSGPGRKMKRKRSDFPSREEISKARY